MLLINLIFFYSCYASAKTLFEAIAADFRRKDACRRYHKSVSVFFYKDDWNFLPDDTQNCTEHCQLINTQKEADLIIWHINSQPKVLAKTHSKQVIGAFGIEPWYNISKSRSLADFTISYSFDNDLIYSYIEFSFYNNILNAKPPTEEEFNNMKTAVFISSNCGELERLTFVRNLMKLISIDSKGLCLNNSPKLSKMANRSRDELKNKYKFYIAIEKRIEEGYISEKFENGFVINSIPVYYGTNQSDLFVSPDSYLHVKSLSDPKSIADQIQRLSSNYTEWLAVFNNRKKNFYKIDEVRRWIEYTKYASGRNGRGNLCRMCDYFCDKYA